MTTDGIRIRNPSKRAAAELRLRVGLHWSENRHNTANQTLSGYTSQTRAATFNPTCVSIRFVHCNDTPILRALQQVSDHAIGSKQAHFVGARQSGEVHYSRIGFSVATDINSNVFDFYFPVWSLS